MSSAGRILLAAAICLACVPASNVFAQEKRGTGAGGDAPLKMEELEVRGSLEKPGRLYLPSPARVLVPLPVRFDFFREDLAKPILPSEITNDKLPNGGAREAGNAVD